MTVAALPSSVQYVEDGATVAFPVPFRFKSASDLVVERIADGVAVRLVLGADYLVTGGVTDAGGTLTRAAATDGATLRITRRTARSQPMVYSTNDRFPAKSHEEALDRGILIDQEQDDRLADIAGRSLMLPLGELAAVLPPAALRAGRVMMFDPGSGLLTLKPEELFAPGAPGPAGPTFVTLPSFKAAPITNRAQALVAPGLAAGPFFFDLSDYTGQVDEVNVVAAAGVSPATGAWVRPTATAITLTIGAAQAIRRPLSARMGELPVSVREFGARGDGVTADDDAFDRWLSHIRATDRAGFIPMGRYRLTRPQTWRPRTTGYPAHSLTIRGESMDGTVLWFDYADAAPCLEINPPYDILDPAGYTGMESSWIGGFTIEEKDDQFHRSLLCVYNTFSTKFCDIRLKPNGLLSPRGTSEFASEFLRVTSGVQWCRFENIIVDPVNVGVAGQPQGQQSYYGTGISIGNGYRDGPKTNQYAISNNTLYNCRVYHCHFGFLTEAADSTTLYDCVAVQNDRNYVDRAAYSTMWINPWDEGERMSGFVMDATIVEDSTGTSMRKTQYPQLLGGYVGSVLMSGVIGGVAEAAMNRLEVTAQAQRSRARVLGQDAVVVVDDDTDSQVEWFRTADNRHVRTIGAFENAYETPAGAKLLTLSSAKGVGLVLKSGIEPTVNDELVFQKVSNTQITMRFRGADGVVRTLSSISGGTMTFA